MKTEIYAGIDVGLDGGIVVTHNGAIHFQTPMPTIKLGKGRKLDVVTTHRIIQAVKDDGGTFIIEDPGGHAPSAAGLRSMSLSFGALEALLIVGELRHQVVRAQKWQKHFWSKPKMAIGQKFDTKAAALCAANRIWPAHDWTKSERASKAHDGMVDAALMTEWGRINRI